MSQAIFIKKQERILLSTTPLKKRLHIEACFFPKHCRATWLHPFLFDCVSEIPSQIRSIVCVMRTFHELKTNCRWGQLSGSFLTKINCLLLKVCLHSQANLSFELGLSELIKLFPNKSALISKLVEFLYCLRHVSRRGVYYCSVSYSTWLLHLYSGRAHRKTDTQQN